MKMPPVPRTRRGRIVLGAAALGLAVAAGGAAGALAYDPWIRPAGHTWWSAATDGHEWVATPAGNPWHDGHPRIASTDGHSWSGASIDGHGWGDGNPWGDGVLAAAAGTDGHMWDDAVPASTDGHTWGG